jgi:hypothetical protein
VELSIQCNNPPTLNGWISRQHHGAIPSELRTDCCNFRKFFESLADKLDMAVHDMSNFVGKDPATSKHKCFLRIESLLLNAMDDSAVKKYGRVKWMSCMILSDIEEFIVEPFGKCHDDDESSFTIPEGSSSWFGYDMVCRSIVTIHTTQTPRYTFQECLLAVVSHILNNVSDIRLQILGYEKVDGIVYNSVNLRPFSQIDAEHFLCKAWIIAKLTFGHNQISKIPELSHHYTHPSPVIHMHTDAHVLECMKRIVDTYKRCMKDGSDFMTIPQLCQLPREMQTVP